MEERGIANPAVIADSIGRPTSPASSFVDHHQHVNSSAMGRTPTKSVARVYADVNAKLGPSWHEYGTVKSNTSCPPPVPTSDLAFEDNLQVQWGSQDHYEIVRKVGRGKYSEVSTGLGDLPTLGSHFLYQKFWSKGL